MSGSSKNRDGSGDAGRNNGRFVPGDPRINLKGRPPLSQQQREFRQALHSMQLDVLNSVQALVKAKDPTVLNKLIEKLGGADAINMRVTMEREQAEFLAKAKEILPPDAYEKLLAAYASDAG